MNNIKKIFLAAMVFTTTGHAQHTNTIRQQAWPTGNVQQDEDVEWRQDVYREVLLTEHPNSGLYSTADQQEKHSGLFAHLFNLAANNKIKVYRYNINDGNEKLSKDNVMPIKELLTDFHIPFTEKNGQLLVKTSDIPYEEVTMLYLKEAVYFNARNASFRKKVVALCPVIRQQDEVADMVVRYPLFWVDYSEAAPFLRQYDIIPDYANIAAQMSIDDFFMLGAYKGDIYKVYNPQGSTLPHVFGEDSIKVAMAQQRIERQLADMPKGTFNVFSKK